MDVVVAAPPSGARSDATNYLGGIVDVLQDKGPRGPLPRLGERSPSWTSSLMIDRSKRSAIASSGPSLPRSPCDLTASIWTEPTADRPSGSAAVASRAWPARRSSA